MHDEHVSHGAEPGHDAAIPVHDRHGAHVADEHAHSSSMYMRVFYALCVFTLLSVIADLMGGLAGLRNALGQTNVKVLVGLLVLAIACCKATFVMLYFMHLKFEGKWKYVLLAPTMVLALAIPAALTPDIGVHYYTVQTPQSMANDADEADPHAAPHGADSQDSGAHGAGAHGAEKPGAH